MVLEGGSSCSLRRGRGVGGLGFPSVCGSTRRNLYVAAWGVERYSLGMERIDQLVRTKRVNAYFKRISVCWFSAG